MYIEIDKELVERLSNYKDDRLVLDLDDGVGRYTKVGSCSLDISFRLLVLNRNQDHSDYMYDVGSELGPIAVKDHSKLYLENEMSLVFDSRMSLIKLKGPSGLIDGNVQIIDLRKTKN
ncbi:iron-sulfur cluster biosynthesis family protein [Enterococcus hermanniensis]|uniref:Core domain-containing protein n=1 Tax=Enterococcus hermanniensis TaxID=249189 RepID=A0A1L8TNS0_9ENTE|nr:iron-sulfur cluster biosynthesis family protein [Enterococcus hermanniensis]OJG45782.1 hypothetical protein RV04_GL001548 [Enterococcus hermanniensis]